jgi:hypothetical protein
VLDLCVSGQASRGNVLNAGRELLEQVERPLASCSCGLVRASGCKATDYGDMSRGTGSSVNKTVDFVMARGQHCLP